LSLNGNQGVGPVVIAREGPAFRFVGTHTGTATVGTNHPAVDNDLDDPGGPGI
jgi:hypothetical protein